MSKPIVNHWLELRVLVGYLGEKSQCGWWPTTFFDRSAPAFLTPIYPRTVLFAQYQGAREAARRVHDEFVGVGHAFHLFRLPEEWEMDLHRLAQGNEALEAIRPKIAGKEEALSRLRTLAEESAALPRSGPVALGEVSILRHRDAGRKMAEFYLSAFENDLKSYPYLSE